MMELGWVALVAIGFWLGFAVGGATGYRAALIKNEEEADKQAYIDELGLPTASDVDLLYALVERNTLQSGPVRSSYHGCWYDVTIAVGKDNVASIRFPCDTLKVLETEAGVRNVNRDN